eukprot:6482654-Amphidinium_carterae.1
MTTSYKHAPELYNRMKQQKLQHLAQEGYSEEAIRRQQRLELYIVLTETRHYDNGRQVVQYQYKHSRVEQVNTRSNLQEDCKQHPHKEQRRQTICFTR